RIPPSVSISLWNLVRRIVGVVACGTIIALPLVFIFLLFLLLFLVVVFIVIWIIRVIRVVRVVRVSAAASSFLRIIRDWAWTWAWAVDDGNTIRQCQLGFFHVRSRILTVVD